MNYDGNFVVSLLDSFHVSFEENRSTWCEISGTSPEGHNYKRWSYQKLYTLRYFPAYYLEYCVLAEELNDRLKNHQQKITVASFGCGICADYFALQDNLEGIAFDYVGYDIFKWTQKKLIPRTTGPNFSFNHFTTDSFKNGDLDDIDVFFFPKSIGDIQAGGGLEHLANVISSTTKKRIFFLNSYVSNGSETKSENAGYFQLIHDKLTSAGFKTSDDVGGSRWLGDEFGDGLKKVCSDFNYPEEYFISCSQQGKFPRCSSCGVVKRPVMTNRFMDFNLLEYSRP